MLNKIEINKVLTTTPLCDGHLVQQRGMVTEFCAMGALARAVGATVEYLKQENAGGSGIWADFGPAIKERFGIESLAQFQTFMHVNDAAENPIVRTERMKQHIQQLSPGDIDRILDDNYTTVD